MEYTHYPTISKILVVEDEFDFKQFINDFVLNQQPLGPDFEKVLADSLDELYER